MSVFVVNRELAGISMEDLGAAQQAAITTADRFREQGQDVSYLRSVFIPAPANADAFSRPPTQTS